MPLLTRRSIFKRVSFLSALVLLFLLLRALAPDLGLRLRRPTEGRTRNGSAAGRHPIDGLTGDARLDFEAVLGKRSATLEQAVARYLERRGRRPPPGFGDWYAAAAGSRAVVVEDFFDRIYHDVAPLWALDPRQLRARARGQASVIRVRRGRVERVAPAGDLSSHRLEQWARLVGEMAPHVPDLDMAVNTMDESRVLVPWEDMGRYVAEERRRRRIVGAAEAVRSHGRDLGDEENSTRTEATRWITDEPGKYWDHLARACPPESPARTASSLTSLGGAVEYPERPVPAYTHRGFVRNFTASQDPCWQPHLRGMHGTFVESVSMSTTHELVPLFGESKLPRNNELLIPAAVYLDQGRAEYSGGSSHGGRWARKKDAMVWRGAASGGRHKRDNWRRMHRSRFVRMLNGTAVASVEDGDEDPAAATFRLPSAGLYPVAARDRGRLGPWVSTWADVGFVEALCDPPEDVETAKQSRFCTWLRPWFSVADPVPMKEQYGYKYLPDIDGNSFSGRYRAFLLSTSLPLKATIYAEWHDDRLFPWVHFVPMDNSFMDVYALMDYFLRGHDAEARKIAADGKSWAEAVLRREDMKLYVWRLLLEYARVVDDDRDRLAFVEDAGEHS
ncbi:hypothetical protein CDD83_8687 [Cordyceps sp. RAO-2017]|nr:hypothetical protein CDD83_8687 [Cordyceps sp. RAO-2017]